jgi:hypothetical protein
MRKGAIWIGGACLALAMIVLVLGVTGRDDTLPIMDRYGRLTKAPVLHDGPFGYIGNDVTVPASRGLKVEDVFQRFAVAGWRRRAPRTYEPEADTAGLTYSVIADRPGGRSLWIQKWSDGRIVIAYRHHPNWLDRASGSIRSFFHQN